MKVDLELPAIRASNVRTLGKKVLIRGLLMSGIAGPLLAGVGYVLLSGDGAGEAGTELATLPAAILVLLTLLGLIEMVRGGVILVLEVDVDLRSPATTRRESLGKLIVVVTFFAGFFGALFAGLWYFTFI
jgi:hypothetical protein